MHSTLGGIPSILGASLRLGSPHRGQTPVTPNLASGHPSASRGSASSPIPWPEGGWPPETQTKTLPSCCLWPAARLCCPTAPAPPAPSRTLHTRCALGHVSGPGAPFHRGCHRGCEWPLLLCHPWLVPSMRTESPRPAQHPQRGPQPEQMCACANGCPHPGLESTCAMFRDEKGLQKYWGTEQRGRGRAHGGEPVRGTWGLRAAQGRRSLQRCQSASGGQRDTRQGRALPVGSSWSSPRASWATSGGLGTLGPESGGALPAKGSS